MGRQQIVTLARFTLLEALRTRLLWLLVIALALVFGAAYFVQQLAITESARMQIVFSAAATRLLTVFVLSLYILTSVVREFNDKGLELTLSFDLRRSDYILGRRRPRRSYEWSARPSARDKTSSLPRRSSANWC